MTMTALNVNDCRTRTAKAIRVTMADAEIVGTSANAQAQNLINKSRFMDVSSSWAPCRLAASLAEVSQT